MRLFPLLLLAACTAFRPGTNVDPEFAQSWNCDPATVQQRAAALDSILDSGKHYIPQVGWDACNLLAHNGPPTRIDRQQTADGHFASWWYQTQYETHLVSLQFEPQARRWVVTYVGW